MTASAWWNTRTFVAAMLIASIVPLLWPGVPPLTDLPGHIGRYRILAEAGLTPLAHHYAVAWAPIGNLGVDALVLALHPLLDVEPAARLVVTAIPVLTVAAALWLAYEVHGRLPATAAFALPLAYAFPFQLGFVNFCLAGALVLAAMAGWIRLARTRKTWVRIALFAPIACVVWLCHSFGWAMLGLFVFGIEWQRRMTAGAVWWRAAIIAALCCAPMALPLFALLATGQDRLAGETGDWFHWSAKAQWLISILRERWKWWDIAGAWVVYSLIWAAVRSKRLAFAPMLAAPAALGAVAFVLLPRLYQGGSYVDMRLLPITAMIALLAIRVEPGHGRFERRLAVAGAAFLALRMTGTTIAFALLAQGQVMQLRALPALIPGGATLVLVAEPDSSQWSGPRMTHISGLAIARRRVFTNEQWALPGQQLIAPRHPAAAPFDRDPSHLVYPADSEYITTDFDDAIARFDRCTFDSVWTIGFPAGRAHAGDLTPVWAGAGSAVYRVSRHECLSKPPSRP